MKTASPNPVPAHVATPEELRLVEALRRRDEAAFLLLVETHHNSLLRLAQMYVRTRDVAEEVVQETWLGVLKGIDSFESRSSLKTWIFRILMNRARTRAEREGRTIPFSQLFDPQAEPGEPAMDPDRFLPADHPIEPGHWAQPPTGWGDSGEKQLLTKEMRAHIQQAIEALPANQREVITLRDVEGWTSEEVCNALRVSETNQRVLLHRARTKVRRKLDDYLGQR
ncbi:MAG: sigma-70 family RNA polymerase sigma factor [Acidobacteria bacterium]|nr:sigma-70 family RNA polymerase sigma factor [Acidobacteriota bacterium]